MDEETGVCPFCNFRPTQGEYELLLHIETHHSEGQSPFVAEGQNVSCPHADCGEVIAEDELDYHVRMHGLESSQDAPAVSDTVQSLGTHTARDAVSDTRRSSSKDTSRSSTTHPPKSHVAHAWRMLFAKSKASNKDEQQAHRRRGDKGSGKPSQDAMQGGNRLMDASAKTSARLGKSELGRFAHEKEMPGWLVSMLRRDGQACTEGIVPVLQQLLEHSPSTDYAYICGPLVHHISKLRREGGFCGYRNIQMLVSHIISARATGYDKFGPQFPTIFQIQDTIENAWDRGINAQGRVETGGIKGTRKYIGTPEAQAFFRSLEIPCWVQAFKNEEHSQARSLLLSAIEDYFAKGWGGRDKAKVRPTSLPPVYFQHRGHSLTIIGLEKLGTGHTQLLVFDPTFRDSHAIRQLIGRQLSHKSHMVEETLEPYRRGKQYLKKYGEFELL